MHFQPLAVLAEPPPDVRLLVVGRVVLDEMHSVRTRLAVGPRQSLQEAEVGVSVEDGVSSEGEARRADIDRAEDLYTLACARDGNQRLAADPRPGLVERRVLSEARFVFEDDGGSGGAGFFLMFGYV